MRDHREPAALGRADLRGGDRERRPQQGAREVGQPLAHRPHVQLAGEVAAGDGQQLPAVRRPERRDGVCTGTCGATAAGAGHRVGVVRPDGGRDPGGGPLRVVRLEEDSDVVRGGGEVLGERGRGAEQAQQPRPYLRPVRSAVAGARQDPVLAPSVLAPSVLAPRGRQERGQPGRGRVGVRGATQRGQDDRGGVVDRAPAAASHSCGRLVHRRAGRRTRDGSAGLPRVRVARSPRRCGHRGTYGRRAHGQRRAAPSRARATGQSPPPRPAPRGSPPDR